MTKPLMHHATSVTRRALLAGAAALTLVAATGCSKKESVTVIEPRLRDRLLQINGVTEADVHVWYATFTPKIECGIKARTASPDEGRNILDQALNIIRDETITLEDTGEVSCGVSGTQQNARPSDLGLPANLKLRDLRAR